MEERIGEEIRRFVAESQGNRFPDDSGPYFDEPLVGFAAAADPLFSDYKKIIGDFHLMPSELLDGAATVIVWVLPVTAATRMTNRLESDWPSRKWALTRSHGETLNGTLRRHLVAHLEGLGHQAVAPQYSPAWKEFADTPVGIASTWSERHAAYAAGLGTFSLSDGLITERGIAHRVGSVITTLTLSPTHRTAPDHRHNCLWYREGSCGICIGRCPVGAITFAGHDKPRCREFVYGAAPREVSERYGVQQTGCGLCQTRVPCEAAVPRGRLHSAAPTDTGR
ncbi:epoxyqueuosine reductase [Geomobilimonas luticola]|uniref:Epoxyqueuosine reductase n=1 Tax=Geomobilimonas luticola TaxID=1114878 RepID=A0ABS5SCT7_9BACT|nr:epoxyqueuosine reductase [Geomobilimonas luticola]MBT0652412.1 epoxyqueuosine reductase [Geomobilimonas luticola]